MRAIDIDSVKHGKWVYSFDGDSFPIKTCSECGSEMPYIIPPNYLDGDWIEAKDYCWHCGAKMDGDSNG